MHRPHLSLKERYFGQQHVTVIEPPRRFEGPDLRELWAYRELLYTLAKRQIRVRYKQTALGAAWALIQPVAQMVVFTVIFSRIAQVPSGGFPYPVFVYSGLLTWNYFSNATSQAVASLVSNSHLISKVYFPRMIIPLAVVLAGLVDFALTSVVMFALMLWFGVAFGPSLLVLPLVMLMLAVCAAGVGCALGALNVAFRDLQHAMPLVMQLWLYATPVVYPASSIPQALRWIVNVNPVFGLVEAGRCAFLGKPFDMGMLAISAAISAAIFVVGVFYFHRVERRFADVV